MSHPKSLGAAGPWVPATLCATSRVWTPGLLDMAPLWFLCWPRALRGRHQGASAHVKGGGAREGQGGACSGGQACPAGAAMRGSCFFQKEEPEHNQGKEFLPTCVCEGLENTVWSPNPGHVCHREPGATIWLWGH